MTIFIIYKSLFYVILMMEIIHCQDNPCSKFIQISEKDNNYYGRIEVPTPNNHNNIFQLNIRLTFANITFSSQNLDDRITFLGTVEDIMNKSPLVFKLEFPPWNIMPPKITLISINNIPLCVGEPIPRQANLQISKVDLKFTLRVTTIIVNSYGNNKPTMIAQMDNGWNSNINNNNNNFPYKKIESTLPTNDFQKNYPIVTSNQYNPNDQINTERTTQPTFNYHPNYQNSYPNLISATSRYPTSVYTNFDSCGKSSRSDKLIANGKDAQIGAHPWVGALFLRQHLSNPKYLCGATLISRKLALTAGHCVAKYSHSDLHLVFGRIGVNDWLDDNGQKTRVDKVELHPDYKEATSDSDIAILYFTQDLTFTSTVSPVCLWEKDDDLKHIVNQTGVVVGWGQNENYQNVQNLQELYVPVVSEETCLRSSGKFNDFTSNRTFCAGRNDNSNSGPCSGDSGGGFYFNVNGKWTIRGIVSRSLLDKNDKCNLKQYAVYSDVAKYIPWIRKFL